jgi:hypothetical protein
MDTAPLIIIIVIGVIVVALLVGLIEAQRRKSRKLRRYFGPEYDYVVVQEHGRARRAEAILEQREKRFVGLHIRRLTPVECDQFKTEWRLIQEQFVDDPTRALARAEALVNQALRTRGYPTTNYQETAADISVEMPRAASQYRTVHGIAERHAQGKATTEELRRAMQMYREVFESALQVNPAQPVEVYR